MSDCCECKAPLGDGGIARCADCGRWFHYPDSRLGETGAKCGNYVIGLRVVLGADVVPLCLRCDMAFRLRHGVPS